MASSSQSLHQLPVDYETRLLQLLRINRQIMTEVDDKVRVMKANSVEMEYWAEHIIRDKLNRADLEASKQGTADGAATQSSTKLPRQKSEAGTASHPKSQSLNVNPRESVSTRSILGPGNTPDRSDAIILAGRPVPPVPATPAVLATNGRRRTSTKYTLSNYSHPAAPHSSSEPNTSTPFHRRSSTSSDPLNEPQNQDGNKALPLTSPSDPTTISPAETFGHRDLPLATSCSPPNTSPRLRVRRASRSLQSGRLFTLGKKTPSLDRDDTAKPTPSKSMGEKSLSAVEATINALYAGPGVERKGGVEGMHSHLIEGHELWSDHTAVVGGESKHTDQEKTVVSVSAPTLPPGTPSLGLAIPLARRSSKGSKISSSPPAMNVSHRRGSHEERTLFTSFDELFTPPSPPGHELLPKFATAPSSPKKPKSPTKKGEGWTMRSSSTSATSPVTVTAEGLGVIALPLSVAGGGVVEGNGGTGRHVTGPGSGGGLGVGLGLGLGLSLPVDEKKDTAVTRKTEDMEGLDLVKTDTIRPVRSASRSPTKIHARKGSGEMTPKRPTSRGRITNEQGGETVQIEDLPRIDAPPLFSIPNANDALPERAED